MRGAAEAARGAKLLAAALLAAGPLGCAGGEPAGDAPPVAVAAAEPRPARQADGERAAGAALAARLEAEVLERPLDAKLHGHLGWALLEAERPGRALVHLRVAGFLLEHPPAADLAREAPADLDARVEKDAQRALAQLRGGAATADPGARDRRPSRPLEAERTARATRRRLDEARAAFDESRYDEALAIYEDLRPLVGPALARLAAACHLRLAADEAREGRYTGAVERLLAAADADPGLRTGALYEDVGRLWRREALQAGALGDRPAAEQALLRSFFADPGSPETLFLLARRSGEAVGDATGAPGRAAAARAFFQRTLRALHPRRPESVYFSTAERLRAAHDDATALAIARGYEQVFPQARALAAELKALVAERRRGTLAEEVAQARAAYQALLAETREARLGLQRHLEGATGLPGEATPVDQAPEPELPGASEPHR